MREYVFFFLRFKTRTKANDLGLVWLDNVYAVFC